LLSAVKFKYTIR